MRLLVAAALSLFALSSTAMAAPDAGSNNGGCFSGREWTGWTAPGNGDALLLRVNTHEIYQVDLTPGSHVRKSNDRFLINRQRGSDMICSPLDLDLTLSDHHGFRQPLIARSIHRLSDAEMAALAPHDRP